MMDSLDLDLTLNQLQPPVTLSVEVRVLRGSHSPLLPGFLDQFYFPFAFSFFRFRFISLPSPRGFSLTDLLVRLDLGTMMTLSGQPVVLKKNSVISLSREDAEPLIAQGLVQHIVDTM